MIKEYIGLKLFLAPNVKKRTAVTKATKKEWSRTKQERREPAPNNWMNDDPEKSDASVDGEFIVEDARLLDNL